MGMEVHNRIDEKIERIKSKIDLIMLETMQQTIDVFYAEVEKNISLLPAHTDWELEMLGRPFARRHGNILPHAHDPSWGVHLGGGDEMDYGAMLLGFVKEVEHTRNMGAVIGRVGWLHFHDNIVNWVIEGTDRMVPRPVLRLTAEAMDLKTVLLTNLKNNVEAMI